MRNDYLDVELYEIANRVSSLKAKGLWRQKAMRSRHDVTASIRDAAKNYLIQLMGPKARRSRNDVTASIRSAVMSTLSKSRGPKASEYFGCVGPKGERIFRGPQAKDT